MITAFAPEDPRPVAIPQTESRPHGSSWWRS